jgi:class 3 adenylate cyclase
MSPITSPLPQRYPEERRWASVLFADVRGFTALSERMDFESVSDLIKGVWLRLDAVIQEYGGYVDKHLGDGVMAVWGAPFAGENDAEQAVSAGVALLNALTEYRNSLHHLVARELMMSVGVNTGYVLAGYVGVKDEYTVMGDTVNVAKRLEQVADPGTVVISESTYRQVRDVFKVRHLEPLVLKGKTEPVVAHVVSGRLEQPGKVHYRSEGGLVTRMVARELELEKLTYLYKLAVRSDRPVFAVVTGDAGIGKSRLLMEFSVQLDKSESALNIISARALAQTARVPFCLWKSLWHDHFGLQDSDSMDEAREKFVSGVQSLWGLQMGPGSAIEAAHLIGSLTGQLSHHQEMGLYGIIFHNATP